MNFSLKTQTKTIKGSTTLTATPKYYWNFSGLTLTPSKSWWTRYSSWEKTTRDNINPIINGKARQNISYVNHRFWKKSLINLFTRRTDKNGENGTLAQRIRKNLKWRLGLSKHTATGRPSVSILCWGSKWRICLYWENICIIIKQYANKFCIPRRFQTQRHS